MKLPSDSWKTPEELVGHWSGPHKAWTQVPFDAIEHLASSLRFPAVGCRANRSKYGVGGNAIVIELVFDDAEVWIAKLFTYHYEPYALQANVVHGKVRCEVATLKAVKERTSIPVPTPFGFSATADNPVGLPYIFMSALIGHNPLDIGIPTWVSGEPVTPEGQRLLDTYCLSLANVHLELKKISEDRIGCFYVDDQDSAAYVGPDADTGIGPCATSAEFYAAYGQFIMKDALRSEPAKKHEGRLFGVWLARLLLSAASIHERGSSRGYFLKHHDLHSNNILVSETGEIVGVLDWDSATCVPEELFAAQAIEFYKDMGRHNVEQLALFGVYNHALRKAEPGTRPLPSGRLLAELHNSTIVQMLARLELVISGDPIIYEQPWFWGIHCAHLLGTADWKQVQESPVFQEWLMLLKKNAGVASRAGSSAVI